MVQVKSVSLLDLLEFQWCEKGDCPFDHRGTVPFFALLIPVHQKEPVAAPGDVPDDVAVCPGLLR